MNYNDIKQELLENWAQFADNQDPYDLLTEFADSACPIYYHDIIIDWQEMPSEFDDSWKEFELDANVGITARMSSDLFNYYRHQYQTIYNELAETMPAKEEENA
jgi:hypothetical protein